ncbi:hypothetical protein ABH930_001443 [Kitasatospora sp. GAS204A]|uniref:SAV_915 family protein n=1 Tax=unclassified Kitasatospora TaxID=2633591 RepID=UPI0024768BAF|nr:SAV_915 family protein [Kitasatospora sp. GAS204B]MDH6118443.1 hypothetical protein [Kitasatospora sp. GAS204B]
MTTAHRLPASPALPVPSTPLVSPGRPEPSGAPEDLAVRHVPVRIVGGTQLLRLFRQRDGSRCAVAFSSLAALRALLGPEQASAELTEPALRELTEPLGVYDLVLDPRLVAPPAPPAPPAPSVPFVRPSGHRAA